MICVSKTYKDDVSKVVVGNHFRCMIRKVLIYFLDETRRIRDRGENGFCMLKEQNKASMIGEQGVGAGETRVHLQAALSGGFIPGVMSRDFLSNETVSSVCILKIPL